MSDTIETATLTGPQRIAEALELAARHAAQGRAVLIYAPGDHQRARKIAARLRADTGAEVLLRGDTTAPVASGVVGVTSDPWWFGPADTVIMILPGSVEQWDTGRAADVVIASPEPCAVFAPFRKPDAAELDEAVAKAAVASRICARGAVSREAREDGCYRDVWEAWE